MMTGLFEEVKAHLTMRQVAEFYGLQVTRGDMACCPFHGERHPSMKIYQDGFKCFACGAHGDAVGYVAQTFGLSQYDAACKLVEDFRLPVTVRQENSRERERARLAWKREKAERDQIEDIKKRFRQWCVDEVAALRDAMEAVQAVKDHYRSAGPDVVFASPEFAAAVEAEPLFDYWLDILGAGSEQDRIELFMNGRKEVGGYVRKFTDITGNMEGRGGGVEPGTGV